MLNKLRIFNKIIQYDTLKQMFFIKIFKIMYKLNKLLIIEPIISFKSRK